MTFNGPIMSGKRRILLLILTLGSVVMAGCTDNQTNNGISINNTLDGGKDTELNPDTRSGEIVKGGDKNLEPNSSTSKGNICCKKGTDFCMAYAEAVGIVQSEFSGQGSLSEFIVCNEITGTIWIDFKPLEPKEGCNPAIVVGIETKNAEINWRCTGLIGRYV